MMGTKGKGKWKRWLCAGMTAVFLLETAGCGMQKGGETQVDAFQILEEQSKGTRQAEAGRDEASGNEVSGEESSVSGIDSLTDQTGQGGAQENENNTETIYDFYDYVNADWIQGREEQEQCAYSYLYDTDRVLKERLMETLGQIDINTLDPKEDLYKVVYLYHQLVDQEYRENYGNEKFKKFLDKIDKVKDLKDLYALYQEEDYEKYNGLMAYRIQPGVAEYNFPVIEPATIWNNYQLKDEALNVLSEMLMVLGYSESRAREIIENARTLDGQIYEACSGTIWENGVAYLYQDQLDEKQVKFPAITILKNNGATNVWEGFMANPDVPDLWNKVYHEENVPLLRDHMLVAALVSNSEVMGDAELRDLGYAFCNAQVGIMPVADRAMEMDFLEIVAEDTLSDLYCSKYLDEEIIPFAEELAKSLSNSMRNLIGEISWITIDGEQLLKNKMFYAKKNLGRNECRMDLSGIQLSDDLMENVLAFRRNRQRFSKEQLKTEKNRKVFLSYVLDTNGVYYIGYNAYMIGAGFLSMDANRPDASYEERLASIGVFLAHEIAHAYDGSSIVYDEEGDYYPWMRDSETEKLKEYYQKLVDFYDGRTDSFGEKIDGAAVANEAFADLTAVGICLRELGKQENPDYDLFFRTYARILSESASYQEYKKDAQKRYLSNKDRVNLILGHFQEFYDTYEIAEDGASYIPQQERLPLL